MNRETACEAYRRLLVQYPIVDDRRHFLNFHNPFETLILTILSAQTTDRAVNAVRDTLFSRYPTPEELARAEPGEVEPIIKSIGFHRTKARHIVETARKLVSDFGGEVPQTMEELQTLPGVGRKTANIVLSQAFGINVGIAVDTHVRRVSKRIGFTDSTNPAVIERDLMALFPHEVWRDINYLLIRHGRAVCTAQNPKHDRCVVADLCRYCRELRAGKPPDEE
ncbi:MULTISPECIES: endonuclease III [unclassified Methanoculleus]|jgi:endonuclease-3|uniref:Endonuclease III n=1 Tax=Methanoculleus palmolei TaxID=72612 RepID=A0ABD8A9G3_9EURY|nr:endonuclease III [Methanoculleus sp. UBA377]WOX55693.1 endonuclease III [Methanoculleus palmolei]